MMKAWNNTIWIFVLSCFVIVSLRFRHRTFRVFVFVFSWFFVFFSCFIWLFKSLYLYILHGMWKRGTVQYIKMKIRLWASSGIKYRKMEHIMYIWTGWPGYILVPCDAALTDSQSLMPWFSPLKLGEHVYAATRNA